MKCEIRTEKIDTMADNHFSLIGGDNRNPTWETYLSEVMEEYRPHFIAAKDTIEKSEFYRAPAENFANSHYLWFEDGITMSFSWRAWGDFMQAIVDKQEGYMTYYI